MDYIIAFCSVILLIVCLFVYDFLKVSKRKKKIVRNIDDIIDNLDEKSEEE